MACWRNTFAGTTKFGRNSPRCSTLFGYYECDQGCDYAARVQAESPVVDRWNEYMKDVMIMEMDPVTGAQPKLTQVFFHK